MAEEPREGAGGREGTAPPAAGRRRSGGALTVAGGILASRLFGYVRELGFAHFLGIGPYADVLRTALRAPNALQVLLGEGTLSASFIPVYTRFLAEGREREAGRFAGAVFGLLTAVTAAAVLAGVLAARPLVALLAPGFTADAEAVAAGTAAVDRYELAVRAVRIVFPMVGFLVLSVWALGVLNSHRRFFLAYFAPVAWNASIVTALLLAAGGVGAPAAAGGLERLLFAACLGALVGGALQFAVQLPLVAHLLAGFRVSLSTRVAGVRQALAAFGPVVAARGVVQLAGYLDLVLASLLAAGAVAALGPGQYLYMLPVSLFGMSVAAAELPELARAVGRGGGPPPAFVQRVRRGLAQTAFLTVPTAVGYLAFGDLVVSALFRSGRFGAEDARLVSLVLAGYSLGLVATTASRLLQNTFYALQDTRTPARTAVLRVTVSAVVALPLMFWLDRFPVVAVAGQATGGQGLRLGAVGLALGSALGAWVELVRLRAVLTRRLDGFAVPWRRLAATAALAGGAALPAAAAWSLLPPLPAPAAAALVLGAYALVYLGAARLTGLSEAGAWLGRLRRRS